MSDLHPRYSHAGFSLEYREIGCVWGWFTRECIPMAPFFVTYVKDGLVFVIPYGVFCGGRACVYTDAYCVGQKTATGKISEAYQWEDRMEHHGFTPELIKKIKDFLRTENR
ncbi:MAG: hypothetical protein WCT49_01555 [Candidatus Paceibacterota bacterium]|jgi:hypothetical protein|nr:hypothetical protein [Candidatus Paceibacterota bacterium]